MSKFKLFRRRGFALFLSFVMCLSLLPPTAMAEALEPEQTDAVITAGTADGSAMTEDKDVSYEEETGAEDASNEEEATAGDPSHEEETTAGTVSDEEETGAEDVSEEEKTDAEAPSDEEETRAEDVSDKEETGTEDVSTEEETGAEDASNEEETEAGDVPEEETALIAQFHSLLDAMEAFVLTADNQEEYQALGMQAAAVMEALMESYYGWDGMESDLARFQELAGKQAGGAEPMAAKWHTVTLVPTSTNSYSSKITSAKVKVGDKVNGYEVTSVSGTTIKVKAWGDLYGDFFLPKAADLWNGAVKSDYVIWASTGSSQKTEGGSAMLPQSNASAYYYFNTAGSVGAGSSGYLWNFTLKYDANGGSGAPETQTYDTNSKYEKSHTFTISSDTPTREDYTFKGWSESSTATSPSYQPNGNYYMSQTVTGYNGGSVTKTLYAVWEKNQPEPEPEQVTLTYMDRGSIYRQESHDKGTDVTIKSCTNTRNGYKFLGWDTDPKAETVDWCVGDGMMLRKDTTIYAVWEKEESGPVDNGGGIEVTKTRVKINDDTSKTTATVGDTITWEIEVVNNSNVQKTVTLIEELAGVKLSKTEVTLAPGKSETVTATYVVQESDVGTTVYNTIKATTGGEGDKENPEDTDEGTKIEEEEVVTEAEYTVEWYDAETGELIPLEDKNPNQVTRKGTVEETVEVKDTDKIVTGYTFDADNQNNVLSDTLKENGTVLKLYFTKDEEEPVEASYTVEWRDAGTGELLPDSVKAVNPETRTGNIGDTVSAADADKRIDGYTYTTVSGTIESTVLVTSPSADENVLRLYFTKDEEEPVETSYTVEWRDAETGELLPDSVKAVNPETRTGNIGDTVSAADADKRIDGYTYTTVSGTIESTVLVTSPSADKNVLRLYFTKDEEKLVEASYTVEWRDAVTGLLLPSTVKAGNPEKRNGNVGETASVNDEDKVVSGYTFRDSDTRNNLEVTLKEDAGENVLRLYFVRNPVTDPVNPDPNPSTPGPVAPVTPTPSTTPNTTDIDDEAVPLAAPGLNSVDHYAYIIGYTDGLVHPEANITRAEVATIFFRLMTDEFRMEHWATENDFPDVGTGNWFNNGVSTSASAGIVKGYEDGSFRPNRNITRAEFAAIAARFLSNEAAVSSSFSDISGHWAEKEINRAVMAGWIKGYTDGTFRPDQPITRAEAVTMINRMLDRTPDKDHLLPDMIRWPDNTEDKWYYADMQEATNSHDYERMEMVLIEDWTELLDNRDWEQLEKEWSTAASAPGKEVADNLDLSKIGENA